MNAIEPILATIRNSVLSSVLAAGTVVDAAALHNVRLTDPAPKRSVGILWRRHGPPLGGGAADGRHDQIGLSGAGSVPSGGQ
ncbi:MAG TPA: hypothetical protein VFT69_02420 [Pseudolabrys sp.]|nr:hypothetical protein [Pseudolabrys sp.]